MTQQQKAVIIGFTKMGATIEEISFRMGVDGIEVQKVVEKVEVLKSTTKPFVPEKKNHWSSELVN